jgi:single-strand DNA-binding protein
MNQVVIYGRLTKDPTMKYNDKGTAIATLRVADNFGSGDSKVTSYWNVSVFGNQAEACNQYLKSGRQVVIVGRVRPDPQTGNPRMWDYEGKTYTALDVTASHVEFVGSKPDDDSGTHASASPSQEPELPF